MNDKNFRDGMPDADHSQDSDFSVSPDRLGGGTLVAVPWTLAIVRIESLIRLPEQGGVVNRARVYTQEGSGWIEWRSRKIDARLHRGGLAWMLRCAELTASGTLACRLLPLSRRGDTFERTTP